MAGQDASLNTVLDGIIIVLVFVLLYLIYRKVIAPEFESQPASRKAGDVLLEETRAVKLMEERSHLNVQLQELKARRESKEIDKLVYSHTSKATRDQFVQVEKQLKEMGLL